MLLVNFSLLLLHIFFKSSKKFSPGDDQKSKLVGNDYYSIPGRVIPKTQKMVLDASLLNTQHYEVWIKGKVDQS